MVNLSLQITIRCCGCCPCGDVDDTPGGVEDVILLENGDALLQEDSSFIKVDA